MENSAVRPLLVIPSLTTLSLWALALPIYWPWYPPYMGPALATLGTPPSCTLHRAAVYTSADLSQTGVELAMGLKREPFT